MFAWWGRTVYRYRYFVIGVMVALCLGGGVFGVSLGDHVTQSGFFDDNSESVRASVLADEVYGRDRAGHVVAVFPAPDGKTVKDPAWTKKVAGELDEFVKTHPDQVIGWAGYLRAPDSTSPVVQGMKTADDKYTFVSIPLNGDDDDTILNNYKDVAPDLQKLNGGKVELAGLNPVADGLTGTIDKDQKRMEVLALPLVAVVLFLAFGGVIAAFLPVLVGGLCIAGALGIMRFTAMFGPVHFFAQPVVTLVGLGIATDYGLFVVSRFREEIAEGYDTETAVRRTVITAGRTVAFSAVLIAVSAASMLVFPQGFLRSLTYAVIATVMLSALLSITVLPAVLGILGPNVDALGVRTLFRVPFLANWKPARVYLNWVADLLQKTKTRDEVEQEFWGKLVNRVMKRPLLFALPIIVIMILLIIPLGKLSLGGFSEKYLPPDNPVRVSQEHFDELFPGYRTEQLTLVVTSDNHKPVTDQQLAEIRNRAMTISGFTDPNDDPAEMWQERPYADGGSKDPSVRVLQNGLVNRNDASKKIDELREIAPPKGLDVMVGGTPALEQDSIHGIFSKMPLMLLILLTTTTLLMFLAFGSLVLPIKATVMSALTLGSTMGILTWIFVDGHFAHLLNFTATPLTAPVIGLIIAVVFGLSTDYEVFLVSRMVEARENGMSTAEAIRIGTATTGRIITAAAAVLAVVAGSFVFSDLVMMKYLAFGLMAALVLDATVVRMFLVPSVMKLLGDDCWWAPRWMKRVQNRIGLGEIRLPNERRRPAVRQTRQARQTQQALAGANAAGTSGAAGAGTSGAAGAAGTSGAANKVLGTATHPAPSTTTPPSVESAHPRPTDRIQSGPPAVSTPSRAATVRMRTGPAQPTDRTSRTDRKDRAEHPGADRSEREIESWLGGLRPDPADPAQPQPQPPQPPHDEAATTAIPSQHSPEARDTQVATEKLNAPAQNVPGQGGNGIEKTRQRRGGGGLSAQELLRREGRY